MAFYQSMNVADSTSMLTNGSTVTAGIIFWPDSSDSDTNASVEKSIEWPKETSTANDNTNTSDSAMMLTQGLAAGAALLAALSF